MWKRLEAVCLSGPSDEPPEEPVLGTEKEELSVAGFGMWRTGWSQAGCFPAH